MSEEIKQNETQQPTTQPADNGSQSEGKMFTQDEVNRIVSDRLARDREKRTVQQQEDAREQALKARETKLDCREYLSEKKYPVELLDVLDTSDVEKFKAAADKLWSVYGMDRPYFVNPPKFTDRKGNYSTGNVAGDPLRDAFKPKA